MIWNKTKECMSREQMHNLQSERLRDTVDRVYHNTPFYRQKMQEIGLEPGDIKSIDDIVKLPFTTKQDLRDNYPYGLFAVPMSEILRIHASSGTTGRPTVVGYTRRDIAIWSEAMARSLTAYGITKSDVVSVAYGYGLFTGGLGAHYGVEKLGATAIPMSTGNTNKHIQLLHDFGATVITTTPSYLLHIADIIEQSNYNISDLNLRVAALGAEPWTESMRHEIESRLNIKGYNIYGLSEIMGPGVSHECEYQNGSHIIEDHFFPEIISPDSLEQLSEGETGELVFTTISKEGIPLLRYRTKDLSSLNYATCECGRTSVRMSRIIGRSDDMLIIRGVNVFPSQIEEVVLNIPELEPHYLIEVDRVNNQDTFEVQVEVKAEALSDDINQMIGIKSRVAARMQSMLGLNPVIKLVAPRTIKRSEGKAVRVIDRRKL